MPLSLSHHSKKHTVNSLLDRPIISYSILTLFYNARFAWIPNVIIGCYSLLGFQIVGLLT